MGRRYLVVSDLHLADLEDNPDGWKYYKGSRYLFDEGFAELLRDFMGRGESGDKLTLILNGDIVDFDLVTAVPDDPPWPVSRAERKRGMDATEGKSAWKLQYVLGFHSRWLAALAEFMAAGHKLVYVLGNHDRELHFPQVQQAFIDALEQQAKEQNLSLARGSLVFEPWFFYVPREIYAEHGHQYDYYNSFRYQLCPVVEDEGERKLALPMGNLSNRYLMSRMGFFNPHAGEFILNLFAYIYHWFKYYAFSRHNLFVSWFVGSLLVVGKLFRMRRLLRVEPPQHRERLERVARTYDLPTSGIEALGQLARAPITQRVFRMLRELWVDRLVIALLMTGGTVALALVPIPLWIKLMVPLTGFPLLYFIYEWAVQGETVFTIEQELPNRARAVGRVLPARVITFGHTHKPRMIPLSRRTTFVDTGTWAPVTNRNSRELRDGLRTYLEVSFQHKSVNIELGSWMPPRGGDNR